MAFFDFLTTPDPGGISLAEELAVPAYIAGDYLKQRQGRIGGPLGAGLQGLSALGMALAQRRQAATQHQSMVEGLTKLDPRFGTVAEAAGPEAGIGDLASLFTARYGKPTPPPRLVGARAAAAGELGLPMDSTQWTPQQWKQEQPLEQQLIQATRAPKADEAKPYVNAAGNVTWLTPEAGKAPPPGYRPYSAPAANINVNTAVSPGDLIPLTDGGFGVMEKDKAGNLRLVPAPAGAAPKGDSSDALFQRAATAYRLLPASTVYNDDGTTTQVRLDADGRPVTFEDFATRYMAKYGGAAGRASDSLTRKADSSDLASTLRSTPVGGVASHRAVPRALPSRAASAPTVPIPTPTPTAARSKRPLPSATTFRLPPAIKKESEAVNYIMRTYGANREEAIGWVKQYEGAGA